MRKQLLVGMAIAAAAITFGCKHNHEANEAGEMSVSSADVPSAAMSAFNRDHPGAMLTSTKRETEKNGAIHYEFKYQAPDGKSNEVEYDAKGNRVHE